MPTEAEWEYACRAGTTTAYNTGSDEASSGARRLVWCQLGKHDPPCGSEAPNAWGLHGMHGSVWEWCWDWYADYGGGSAVDPRGPSSGSDRVNRGGCWGSDAGLSFGGSPLVRRLARLRLSGLPGCPQFSAVSRTEAASAGAGGPRRSRGRKLEVSSAVVALPRW
ncbi:MAG: SUMF1/EgtB/PvdO family nonheme iron enzyme [Betaproteobacteria bacterium]|nr:SUMF1/EgtB/PvdO family nonheme iron enzyme [Betaproteobacteria bacterium]